MSKYKKAKEKLDIDKSWVSCTKCGQEAVQSKYSKYVMPAEYQARYVYICDRCPSIFVLCNLGKGDFYRQDLSDRLLKDEYILPF